MRNNRIRVRKRKIRRILQGASDFLFIGYLLCLLIKIGKKKKI